MTKITTLALAATLAAGLGSTAIAAPAGLGIGMGAASVSAPNDVTPVLFFRRKEEAEGDRRDGRRQRVDERRLDTRRDGTGPGGFAERKRGSRFIGGVDVNRGTLVGNIPGGIGATGR
jgi:hypothetical protein